MKAVTSVIDARIFARECFVTALFTVLLLVAGCAATNDYAASDLAPPPPFMMAQLQNKETFGPPIPVEIAMIQQAETIEPAAGNDGSPVRVHPKCAQSLVSSDRTHMDVGFGSAWKNHDDVLAFNNSYSSQNSAGMMLRWRIDLPGAGASAPCH